MANLFDPEFDPPSEREGFRYRRARLGRQAGGEWLGTSLYEVEPGQSTFPYHWHLANEEMLIALDEGLSLRSHEGWRRLERGEVVACPRGSGGAHQVLNAGDAVARILIVSELNGPELVVYPDSGKIGSSDRPPGAPPRDDEISLFFRAEDAVDYWDGEKPPSPEAA